MRLLIFSLMLAFPGSAYAQFFGDVYFSEPSKQVIPGDEFEMSVEIFTGNEPFGALRFDLTFDPKVIEITSTETPEGTSYFCVNGGLASFVIANDISLDGPIGTVRVLTLRGRAVGADGDTSSLNLQPGEFRATDGTKFGQGNGFGGTITINTGANALASVALKQVISSSLDKRIDPNIGNIPYRRAGCDLTVVHALPDGRLCATNTVIIDPEAPVELGVNIDDSFRIESSPIVPTVRSKEVTSTAGGDRMETGRAVMDQGLLSMYLHQKGSTGAIYRLERSTDLTSWEDTGLRTSGNQGNLIHVKEVPGESRFFRAVKIDN